MTAADSQGDVGPDFPPPDLRYLSPPKLYRMLGHRFGIQSDLPGVIDLLDSFLAPFRVDGAPSADGSTIYVVTPSTAPSTDGTSWVGLWRDGEPFYLGSPLVQVVNDILSRSSLAGIDSADGVLTLHAGAVSWRGVGAVLPGPSGSGKTTLTAGLTYAGCGYLTDEAALVDLDSGDLRPFARALWISGPSIALVPGLESRLPRALDFATLYERHVAPDMIRPGAVGAPCALRCLIFPTYDKGSSPTVLEPIRRSEALLETIFNSFNFADCGPNKLQSLGRIIRGLSVYRLLFSDLDGAVETVMSVLDEAADAGEAAGA